MSSTRNRRVWYIDRRGYVRVYCPAHPRASRFGYVYEHVLVAEHKLGRPLRSGEEVHHRNEVKTDNRWANLHVTTSVEHHREHAGWVKMDGVDHKPCTGPLCLGALRPVNDATFLFRTQRGRRVPLSRCRACLALIKRQNRAENAR